ncbi:glycosyltransferase involved in cell wall biosynthesis [Sphingorhabdus rigui]|uniref:Glycosyltransferase involved in cell wall biosynthesis n=1 Tax=Sphingorhabdus rigui TaxID=1282858 RepID=A0A840B3Y7_9SPHN|nr:glycosyltransferase [Sphingorhabdus rigui]MBB3944002.1 glycosyltransferase involved in cell wall biosynthesis [Sphingorhabdus rigui]
MTAIDTIGGTAVSECRGFGWSALIRYIYRFYCRRNCHRLIFGTSEVLLTIGLGRSNDVLIFTGLGRLLQAGGAVSKLVRIALRLCYRGQSIISLNSDDQRYLSELFSTQAHLINGEGYQFSGHILSARPRRPLRIAYVGRLLKSKAVDQLISAVAGLNGCRLTLIGDIDFGNSDGIDSTWLGEQIISSGGRIEHVGFIQDVRSVLHDIDVVVSMSIREGLPFAVLDAMDTGCLAVLSPVPGHLAFEGMDGIIFTETAMLSSVLQTIIDSPEKYFRFNPNFRKDACRERFGYSHIATSIETILRQLVMCEDLKNFDAYEQQT